MFHFLGTRSIDLILWQLLTPKFVVVYKDIVNCFCSFVHLVSLGWWNIISIYSRELIIEFH